ncbi:response regulator [Ramlibacter humi]|uniref:Response regulator n=1 Tax=Ramlibacter humi TaxID=2530451 RepID=A0A4Z0C8C5_9BURK|nr:response regulator [Ramlibacter humi]TFZ07936.1 response regulator [Ramlibacter humi]
MTPPAGETAAHPGPASEGVTLLIVDDNEDAVWGLRTLLELAGHTVLAAGTGERGFAAAQAHRPAIALLDIGLPDMSGLELARRIRATGWGHELALVALSGLGQEDDVRQSKAAGFDAHLTKPAEIAQLRALVAELAGRKAKP